MAHDGSEPDSEFLILNPTKKLGNPIEIAALPPDRPRFTKKQKQKQKNTIQHSYEKREMLPNIHQGTQVDHSYEYAAARVIHCLHSLYWYIQYALEVKFKQKTP